MARGVLAAGHEPIPMPIADGGDGSIQALAYAGFRRRSVPAHDALGRPITGQIAWRAKDRVAAVELAETAGLWRVERTARDPWALSSYGFGEHLAAALALRPRELLALLGGSATQDAGAGMLQALGARLLPDPEGFADARWLEGAEAVAALPDVTARVASLRIVSDVDHVLSGPGGSANAFAHQKGFAGDEIAPLDAAIGRFGRLLSVCAGCEVERPGAGAAGGVGAALFALGGTPVQGAAEVFAQIGFFAALRSADALITCEGQVDATTWRGKAPGVAARSARSQGMPAAIICAREGPGARDEPAVIVRAKGSPARAADLALAAHDAVLSLQGA